jgi:hypothetical protein
MPSDMLNPNNEESLALRAVDILRRRRILAIVVFATVLAAAVAFVRNLPDLYRATAMLLIERPVSETFIRTAVSGELESRLHVIKQENLSRDRLTELIKRFNLYPEMRRRASMEEVINQMRLDIETQPSGPEQVTGRTRTVSVLGEPELHRRRPGHRRRGDQRHRLVLRVAERPDAVRGSDAHQPVPARATR